MEKQIKEGVVILATAWEERGKNTGNVHWHGIIKLERKHRKRFTQFKQWLVELAQLKAEPHVEACRNIAAAIGYKDKKEKKEAWIKWCGEGPEPSFFASILLASWKELDPEGATTLESFYKWHNLTKKL